MTNIGTIPDESFLTVVLRDGTIVGKLDEGFLERMRKGDVFVLGGNRYQFLYAKGMKVYVAGAAGKRVTIPSWFSEMLPLSFDVAMSIGEFRELIARMFEEKKREKEIKDFIQGYVIGNKEMVESMYKYFEKQFKYSIIPHKNRILIEEYRDGERNYIIFHTLFGRRVNDALSRAVAYVVASARKRDVEVGINDRGFFIAGKDLDLAKVEKGFYYLIGEFKKDKKNLRKVLDEAIEMTEVLKRRFRHCAGRGLMILRNYKGRVKSVGRQQMSSHFMLAAIRKKTRDFPILKEARREVLEDLMDIEKTEMILNWIVKNRIKVVKKNTNKAVMSPFAISLILASHSDVIRMEDKIEFIKRVYRELEK
tara:strand:- start:1781 stop:2875 length:1095 start_codon:yes stop_codon:yes gene_type:complete